MTSHEYAENLKLVAEFLLQQSAFRVEDDGTRETLYFYDKTYALNALAALQPIPQLEFRDSDHLARFERVVAPNTFLRIAVSEHACMENYQPVTRRLAPEFRDLGKTQEKVA